jgi:hypothetical protein
VSGDGYKFYILHVFSKFLVIATPAYLKAKCFDLQALPIFLDSLVQAWGAILISVTLILLFGEVGIRYFSSGRERVFYFHYCSSPLINLRPQI